MGKTVVIPIKTVVIPLHGIRTHADWQRAFVTLTQPKTHEDFYCPLDDWNFGYFSLLSFLWPAGREKKIDWFRREYYKIMHCRDTPLTGDDALPSIVAHSFGTYILGHALQKYEYIKFDRIILCGSILPRAFDWKEIIKRGQVKEVRNEFGVKDIWVRHVDWFIKGAGPSGYSGFNVDDQRIIQERFQYKHSEYFEKGHMERFWIPFFKPTFGVSELAEPAVETEDLATLADKAEEVINNSNSSQTRKLWSERISKAVSQNLFNKRLALIASRYDAEVNDNVKKAIKRVGTYIELKKEKAQEDYDYAEALFYLACYMSRDMNDREARNANSAKVRAVLATLREAVDIRNEISSWVKEDDDFVRLRSNKQFQKWLLSFRK